MSKVIKLDDLYSNKALAKKESELVALLNKPPKKEWVKEHPFVKGLLYLPIERVEYLLTAIYIKWRFEIREVKLIGNSVVIHGRLHVKDPITNEWDWNDGVGGQPLQTEKDAGAIDFNQLKTNAVQLAAPAAESYAIKDAAEKFGRIFGKDINRKDLISYELMENRFSIDEAKRKLSEYISECQDEEINEKVIAEVTEAEDMGVNTVDFYERIIKENYENRS